MKLKTPLELERQLVNARQDLSVLHAMRTTPALIEKTNYRKIRTMSEVESRITYVTGWIRKAEVYLHDVKHRAFRCSLPKKQQRELGLLPPV